MEEQDVAELDAWILQATIRLSAMEEIMLSKNIMTVEEMDVMCQKLNAQFQESLEKETSP